MNRNEESLNAIFNNRVIKSSIDKETIKKEIENEFWDVFNFVDPMDHYAGVDTSVEKMESWEEEVAKRYGVDPLVINEITQEITRDAMDKAVKEEEWARKNLNDDEFDKWMLGELDISDRINSSKQITSAKSTWKNYLKGLDKLDRRSTLKKMYDMCHWEFLNLELQGTNLNDPENPMMQVTPDFCSTAADVRQFLLECAKENLPGAKENLRKINSLLGIQSSKVVSSFELAEGSGYSPYFGGKPGATYYAGWFVDNETPWVFTEAELSTGKITILGAFATEAEANQFGDSYKQKGPDYAYEVDNVLDDEFILY